MKKHFLGVLIAFSLLAGVVLCALHNHWLIINLPTQPMIVEESHQKEVVKKKICTITYFKYTKNIQEKKELLWSNTTDNCTTLIQTWLSLLYEEELIAKKTTVQTVALTADEHTLIISFDRPPYNAQDSTSRKIALLESLLITLRTHIPTLKSVLFLVHHQPINDYHLDFFSPWPLDGYKDAKNNTVLNPEKNWLNKSTITLMLDPAGDAQNTGRIIGDNFERGITLQYAQALKKELELLSPRLRIVLTRFPGEALEPLQNAAFSNRLQADFYCTLHFYPTHAQGEASRCSIYYFVHNPETDFWPKKNSVLSFTPHNQAHLKNIILSRHMGLALHHHLSAQAKTGLFALEAVTGVPFKPLVGVQAAALGIEIGLHDKESWQSFVLPVARALADALLN